MTSIHTLVLITVVTMFITKWLFPEGVPPPSDTEAIQPRPLHTFREYLERNAPPQHLTIEKDESSSPLLEKHDASTAQDDLLHEALLHIPISKILELKKKQMRAASPLYSGSIARRSFAWTVLLAYLIFVYGGIYYSVYFITDNSTHIATTVSTTLKEAYSGVAEAYDSVMNPPNTQEAADSMLELYELLADMGYYDRLIIAHPPHLSPSVNKTLAAELNMSPAAISLMESLPYLNIASNTDQSVLNWDAGSYGHEFILYSLFADLRDSSSLIDSRDPYYLGPEGEAYIDPDHVALSMPGEEGAILIVDARTGRMWTFNMMGNLDPDTSSLPDNSNYASKSEYSPLQYPSRPARDALRSYINRFKTLEWLPGGGYNGTFEGDSLATLYRENGWGTSSFSTSSFLASRTQWFIDDEARQEAERPFEDVTNLARNIGYYLDALYRRQKELASIDAGATKASDGKEYMDVEGRRKELEEEIKLYNEEMPKTQAKLEAAREMVRGIDPAVRKAREERIARYGY